MSPLTCDTPSAVGGRMLPVLTLFDCATGAATLRVSGHDFVGGVKSD